MWKCGKVCKKAENLVGERSVRGMLKLLGAAACGERRTAVQTIDLVHLASLSIPFAREEMSLQSRSAALWPLSCVQELRNMKIIGLLKCAQL